HRDVAASDDADPKLRLRSSVHFLVAPPMHGLPNPLRRQPITSGKPLYSILNIDARKIFIEHAKKLAISGGCQP
ncbi:hypothetical protein LB579_31210, partial [Mesorhizobium sp. BR1-1-7]|uniref:hypothetical protein n=1 Tax=Mesorhizobium sp. BR1-1-7 TaxID=2876647 RepID=UPI001CCBAA7C